MAVCANLSNRPMKKRSARLILGEVLMGVQGMRAPRAWAAAMPAFSPSFMEAVATPGSSVVHLAQALQPGMLHDLAAVLQCKGWKPRQAEKTVACAQALQEAAAAPEPACSKCGGRAAAALTVPASQEAVWLSGQAWPCLHSLQALLRLL